MHLEVKGRVQGAETFSVTRNEVLHGKNADRYRLALVSVAPGGPLADQVRYLLTRYEGIDLADFAAHAVTLDWDEFWARGGNPQ